MNDDNRFGVCPICGETDGYYNVGSGHWFYCSEHKVTWFVGTNLFSSWRGETREEQEAIYNEMGFGSYRVVQEMDAADSEVKR